MSVSKNASKIDQVCLSQKTMWRKTLAKAQEELRVLKVREQIVLNAIETFTDLIQTEK